MKEEIVPSIAELLALKLAESSALTAAKLAESVAAKLAEAVIIKLAETVAAQLAESTAQTAAKLAEAANKIQLNIYTIWQYQMRRAVSEIVEKKLGTMEDASPLNPIIITFNVEVSQRLDPIRAELQDFWQKDGYRFNDVDVTLEIERLFGSRLLEHVCVPCGLSHGACLILALSVAQNSLSIELRL